MFHDIRRLYLWACFVWMGGAGLYFLQFLSDPQRNPMVIDYPEMIRVVLLLLSPVLLVTLVCGLGRFVRWKGWLPVLALTASIATGWSVFNSLTGLQVALTLTFWFILGGFGLQVAFARLGRITLPLHAAVMVMLLLSSLALALLSFFHVAAARADGLIVLGWWVLGAWALWRERRQWPARINATLRRQRTADWLLLSALIALANLYLFTTQMPEMASDAYRVWLPLLKTYAAQGGIQPQPWFDFSLCSPALLHTLALPYLQWGELGTRMFMVLLGLVFLSALNDILRLLIGSRPVRFTILLWVFAMPMLHWVWYTAQLDAPAFAFSLSGFALILRWLYAPAAAGTARKVPLSLVIGGLLLGFACAGKLIAVPYAAALLIVMPFVLLGRSRGAGHRLVWLGRALWPSILVSLAMMIVILPFWCQTWHWTGDPIFPMLAGLKLKAGAGRTYQTLLDPKQIPWADSMWKWLWAPYFLTFKSRLVVDVYWDTSFGPWLWLLFPLLPFALTGRARARSAAILAICLLAWLFAYLGKQILIRYCFLSYALLFGLLGLGLLEAVRQVNGRRPFSPSARLALSFAAATLSLVLVLIYGLATPWNFGYLVDFAHTHDRDKVTENFWPGFTKVRLVAESLPQDALLAVLRTDDEFVGHLPRQAFEFRPNSADYVLKDTTDTVQSNMLMLSSHAAATISQEKPVLRNGLPAGLWPEDYGWRDASRLILADSYTMFLLDRRLIEYSDDVEIPPLPADQPATTTLTGRATTLTVTDHGTTASLPASGAPPVWQVTALADGGRHYTLPVTVPDGARILSSIWQTTGKVPDLRLRMAQGYTIPLHRLDSAQTDPLMRIYTRQGLNPGAAAIELSCDQVPGAPTPIVAGKLSFFPISAYPVPWVELAGDPLTLPRVAHTCAPADLRGDSWFSAAPPATYASQNQGIPVSHSNWLACTLPARPCQQITVVLHVACDSPEPVNIDLRVESGDQLGKKISFETRSYQSASAGVSQLTAAWASPPLAEGQKLVLVLWPADDNSNLRLLDGSVFYVNEFFCKINELPTTATQTTTSGTTATMTAKLSAPSTATTVTSATISAIPTITTATPSAPPAPSPSTPVPPPAATVPATTPSLAGAPQRAAVK